MEIKMPALPYAPDALAPVISNKTIDFHYGKHLQGYVNTLAKLIEGTAFAGKSVEDIAREAPDGPVFNNAGQIFNHTFYFMQLQPATANNKPQGRLAEAINAAFGSFDEFKTQFAQAATTLFGSGWAWLSQDANGKLLITKETNANCPLRNGLNPLFVIDVWEHAYYIDYQNRRADYIADFWNIVNWNVVAERLK